MVDPAPPTIPEPILADVWRLIGFVPPDACRAGIAANLDILAGHAAVLLDALREGD